MRRLLALVALVAFAAVLMSGAPAALAQTDGQATTSSLPPEGGDIIREPNSGTEPEDAGDRGGALQTVLFFGIIGGVLVMAAIIVRQSRRARAERGF